MPALRALNLVAQGQQTMGQRRRSSDPVAPVIPPGELLNWGESAVSGWTLRPRSSLPRGRRELYPGEQPVDACGERALDAATGRYRVRANNKDLAVAYSWQHPPRRTPDGRWMLAPAEQVRAFNSYAYVPSCKVGLLRSTFTTLSQKSQA
jgi:hypothetical protein